MSLDAKLTGLYNKKFGLEATETRTSGQITATQTSAQGKEADINAINSQMTQVSQDAPAQIEVIDDETGESRLEIDEVAEQQRQSELNKLQQQKNQAEAELQKLNSQISAYEATLTDTEGQIVVVDGDISTTEAEIEQEQKKLEEQAKREELEAKNLKGGVEKQNFTGNEKMFDVMDKDGNGIVDDEEMQTLRDATGENGVLSKREARQLGKQLGLDKQDRKQVFASAFGFKNASKDIESSNVTFKNGVKIITTNKKDGSSSKIQYTTNANGQISKDTVETDKNGNSVATTYNEKGNKTKTVETNAETKTTLTSNFNEKGEIDSAVEVNGNTETTYGKGGKDGGRIDRTVENKGTHAEIVTENEYAEDGTLSKTRATTGDVVTEKTINGSETVATITKSGKLVQKTTTNENGRIEESIRDDRKTTTNFDVDGKKTTSREEQFDKDGNVIRTADITYGENGKRTKATVSDGKNSFEVSYDGNGNTHITVQNGEGWERLYKTFGEDGQSQREFQAKTEELNDLPHGLIVGDDIVIAGEIEADDPRLQGRGSAEEEVGEYKEQVVYAGIKEKIDSGEVAVQDVKVEGSYKSWTDYATQSLKAEGIENPTTNEIVARMNEYLYLNPEVACPKSGMTIKELSTQFDADMAFFTQCEEAGLTQYRMPNLNKMRDILKGKDVDIDVDLTMAELDKMTPAEKRKALKEFREYQTQTFKNNTDSYLTQAEKDCLNELPQAVKDTIILQTNAKIRKVKDARQQADIYDRQMTAKYDSTYTTKAIFAKSEKEGEIIAFSPETQQDTINDIIKETVIKELPAQEVAKKEAENNALETPEQKEYKQMLVDYYQAVYDQASNAFNGQVAKEGCISDAVNFIREVCGSDSSREMTQAELDDFKKRLDTLKSSMNTGRFDRVCREQFNKAYNQEAMEEYIDVKNQKARIDYLKQASENYFFAELDKGFTVTREQQEFRADGSIRTVNITETRKYTDSQKIKKFEDHMMNNMGFSSEQVRNMRLLVELNGGNLLETYRNFDSEYQKNAMLDYNRELKSAGGYDAVQQRLNSAEETVFGDMPSELFDQISSYKTGQDIGLSVVKGGAVALATVLAPFTGGGSLATLGIVFTVSAGMEFTEQLTNDVDDDVTVGKNLVSGAVDGVFGAYGGKIVKPLAGFVGKNSGKAMTIVFDSKLFQEGVETITTAAVDGMITTIGKDVTKGKGVDLEKTEVKTLSKITATLLGNAIEKKTGLNPKKIMSVLNTSSSNGIATWLKSQNISPEILQDENKAADWVRKHQSEFDKHILSVISR